MNDIFCSIFRDQLLCLYAQNASAPTKQTPWVNDYTLFSHKKNICLHLFVYIIGKEEALISCYGCGNSVHPSCRVYSADLVQHFEKEGWTCDDCKTCIVCSESQTNEDLIICEYCDQGVHYSCLSPPPEKRPKVSKQLTSC